MQSKVIFRANTAYSQSRAEHKMFTGTSLSNVVRREEHRDIQMLIERSRSHPSG